MIDIRAKCHCDRAPIQKRKRAFFGSWLTLALGLAASLVPKCPLCIAGYLSLFGLGTAAAGVMAPLFFPIGMALVVLSCASMAALFIRARAAARSPSNQ